MKVYVVIGIEEHSRTPTRLLDCFDSIKKAEDYVATNPKIMIHAILGSTVVIESMNLK